jgi:hypothetical protein
MMAGECGLQRSSKVVCSRAFNPCLYGGGEPGTIRGIDRFLYMLSRCKAAVAVLVALCGTAGAHQAPSGWAYDYLCCSNRDCREISASQVRESPDGYVIAFTGETLAYDDRRIRNAPDGRYHWCECRACKDSPTRCLYVPHRGF